MTAGVSTEILSASVSGESMHVNLRLPSTRYLNELLRLKCAPDLTRLKLFPDAKEVTESLAAHRAAIRYLGPESVGRDDVLLVDVGCGSTPRTAAVFAFRTRWQCVAVDPGLHMKGRWDEIDRLSCHVERVDVGRGPRWYHDGLAVVTAVHCHAPLPAIVDAVRARRLVIIAIPCCVPLELEGIEPVMEYVDWGIWSPHRTVKVYDVLDKEGR